jgi:hypothetical protein
LKLSTNAGEDARFQGKKLHSHRQGLREEESMDYEEFFEKVEKIKIEKTWLGECLK